MGARKLRLEERGFQIWSQNFNKITFYPLFGSKIMLLNGKISILSVFDSFFLPKRGSTVIQFKF